MEEITFLSEDSDDCTTIVNKNDESSPGIADNNFESSSENDFESLKKKWYSLKRSLDEQRVTCNYLREERDEAVALNRLLKREVEELRREVYRGKTSSPSEVQERERNRNYDTGPLEEDESVVSFLLALPRKLVRGLVNKAALFVWWTGAWANEGLGFLQIENKWVELQRLKYELEEDNSRLENQVYALQELLTDKEAEIVRQIERNKDLMNRLNTKCDTFRDKNNPLDKMARHIHTVAAFSESLSEEVERLKATMDRRLIQFERIHHDIGRLTEGQRLLEIAENNLERRVENLADAHAHDFHNGSAEFVQAQGVLPNNVASEKPITSNDEDKSKAKGPEANLEGY
ncbi:hypothetical protein ACROYT_G016441 [Oculina patagonica]